MTKMKIKTKLLAMAAILLVLGASLGTAYSYFTTYAVARGRYTLEMGDKTTIEEEFSSWTKRVSIAASDDSQPVFIRVMAFAPDEYQDKLTYSDDSGKWSPGEDGYYYYADPISASEATDILYVKINGIPESETIEKDTDFNVVVIYESTPVRYDENGKAYADWDAKVDTGTAEGGNP